MANRKAVSILLTRNPDSTEVHLVERNPELKFFGGYFAFPGGTLDENDSGFEIQNSDKFDQETLTGVIAAAREVFEETGVLLTHGKRAMAREARAAYRKKLLAEEMTFPEILKRENHVIDAGGFHPICKIITPEFSPVRYETQFFWAKIPDNQSPEIWPGELVSGQFFSAEEALAHWQRGELLIVPPVLIMLQQLVGRSAETFMPAVQKIAESYFKGKIHRVYFTPGVQLVTLQTRTLLPATHTNTYLVGESELYIIDPASADADEQARLWDYLDDLVNEGRRLKAILLTHHHSDHVGAVEACQRRYRLPLWGHPKTAKKLSNLKFERFLNHGDSLDLGPAPDGQLNWQLKVYHTPGHAAGHLAFQESRYGAVIAGDLISTVSTIVISPPDGHLATYLRSLGFLESVTTGALYPSHGPAVRDGKKVIQYYIQHRREREEKLLNALSFQPQSAFELVKKVYDDVDPGLWPLAEHSLRAGLIKLIEEGKCREVGEKFVEF